MSDKEKRTVNVSESLNKPNTIALRMHCLELASRLRDANSYDVLNAAKQFEQYALEDKQHGT